ncbi:MAG: type II secretion system protein GspD [Akkermansiaceae bacterium]
MNPFKQKLLFLGLLLCSYAANAQTETVEVVKPEGQAAASLINNPAPAEAAADHGDDRNTSATEGENSNPIEAEEGGFLIKDANINDIFQLLAKRSDKQYFHNNKLNTIDYQVTGHLSGDVDPLQQMEELAFQYGLRMYVKGNTVYAMMSDQLNNLPAKEWTYSLQYLRPTDIEQIKALIQPMLSVGRGIVNYEPKTNTIIVIDTMRNIEMVEKLLKKIDKPKGQIVVEVKILRVNNSEGSQTGVDWSASLGDNGTSIELTRSLNSVFGLPSNWSTDPITQSAIVGGSSTTGADDPNLSNNIILSPLQLSGVLRALNEGNIVDQTSNPVVITEDNEKASISLIDRVPIITTTTNQGTSTSSVSEEVRYTIDASDSTDPETTREIGVTISITPSLLPDGTIRMRMRPRSAQITENVKGTTGNFYPRVSEATIQSIARIPDGHSLVIGGFYGEVESKGDNKVPILGDIPLINFFFKSKKTQKEKSSLVFVVTPTSYNPSCITSHKKTNERVNSASSLSQ